MAKGVSLSEWHIFENKQWVSRQSPNKDTVILKVCKEGYFFLLPCTTSSTGAFKHAPQDQLTLVVSCFIWLLCKYWTEAKEFSLSTGSTRQHQAWGNPLALKLCLDPGVWEESHHSATEASYSVLCELWDELLGSWQGSSALLPYPLVKTWEGMGSHRSTEAGTLLLLHTYNWVCWSLGGCVHSYIHLT